MSRFELEPLRRRAARRKKRKSPWNLLLLAFAVLAVAASWISIASLFGKYRASLVPTDAFLNSGSRFGNILMYVAPAFPSIAIGFIAANLLIWCIPAARTTLENEDKQFPGADFRSSNVGLLKLLGIIAVFALPIAFLGARNLWSLNPQGVLYRPMFSLGMKQFYWSDIRSIQTGCYVHRIVEHNFVLIFNDGTRLDIAQENPLKFLEAYPSIQHALTGVNYEFSNSKVTGQCQLSQTWTRVLMERPTPR